MRLAVEGKVSKAVVDAMREELANTTSANNAASWYAQQVEVNLGVALLQLGNAAWDAKVYISLYRESEEHFLSVLHVNPQNDFAAKNLRSVQSAISSRVSAAVSEISNTENPPDSSTMQVRPFSLSTEQHMIVPAHGTQEPAGTDAPEESAITEPAVAPVLTYDEALAQAMQGSLEPVVVDALRREHAAAQRAAAGGISPYASQVAANLGVSLLRLGNRHMNPLDFCPFYLESDAVLRAALERDPSNDNAAQNRAIVGQILANRPRIDDGGDAVCAGPGVMAGSPLRPLRADAADGQPAVLVPVLVMACCRADYLDRYVQPLLCSEMPLPVPKKDIHAKCSSRCHRSSRHRWEAHCFELFRVIRSLGAAERSRPSSSGFPGCPTGAQGPGPGPAGAPACSTKSWFLRTAPIGLCRHDHTAHLMLSSVLSFDAHACPHWMAVDHCTNTPVKGCYVAPAVTVFREYYVIGRWGDRS